MLQGAVDGEALQSFAEAKVAGGEANKDGWKALFSFFDANFKDELVTLLGFPKAGCNMSRFRATRGAAGDKTPSEFGTSVTLDTVLGLRADGESTTTVPSLFDDDDAAGNPQLDAAADFFNAVGIAQVGGNTIYVPHANYEPNSSVAPTIGSGPSSVTSEALTSNSLKICPHDEPGLDRHQGSSLG